MNHESFRELIALHLYGEVEGEERARLERHLEECGPCRSYAREMVEGLGRIAADAGHGSGELPSDWSERLRAAVREEPRVARMHPSWPWWTAAAGFAAGVVAAGMVGRTVVPVAVVERAPTTWERFHAETPPPLATTESGLAHLGDFVRPR
jgi:anti-sigma factor RsiW